MASKSLPFFTPEFQAASQDIPVVNQRELTDYWKLGPELTELQQRLAGLADLLLDKVTQRGSAIPEQSIVLTYKHVRAHRTIELLIALEVGEDPYEDVDKGEMS